jgi:predicted  nucleic acid-binding Zn-ribbon protein
MMRRLAKGYEAQIRHYAAALDEAQDAIDDAIRRVAYISAEQMKQATAASEQRITRAEERMSALRDEVRHVHEEIGELIAKLSDTDLAFLEPPP